MHLPRRRCHTAPASKPPTRKQLLDAVHSAMECREGAQRVSHAYTAAGGASAAADAMEAITKDE